MNPQNEFSQVMPPLSDRDHIHGSPNASIMLMEYGDYQCPQSAEAHRTLDGIQRQLGEHLCFIFRHFPQTQHSQAQRAAETVEAAAAQGKFWEMHNTLFAHQQALEDADLVEYASVINLDIPRLLQELSTRVHAERVQMDIESGRSHGVEETPTFFVSVCHQGAQNLEALLMTLLQMNHSIDLNDCSGDQIHNDSENES